MKKKIMVINTDEGIAQEIKKSLISQDTNVLCVSSMYEALPLLMEQEFCLIILDAKISAEDDYNLLKVLRKIRTMPILILSSKGSNTERLQVLKAGAHAYIGKPYSLEECLAQAQSLMQLYCELKPQRDICYTLVFGKNLIIDPLARQVIFSRKQLYNHVWDEHSAYNVDEVVKAQIKLLRQKLSSTGKEYIQNVWGVGYRFRSEPDDE